MKTLQELNSQITTKVELITPTIAKELLEHNDHNRKLTNRNIDVLVKAIKNDEWQVSGQTIIIDTNGDLADGQHRLEAIVVADVAVFANVCRGVEPKVFTVIDIGKARTGADILSINGVADNAKITTLIKSFNAYKLQHLRSSPKMSNTEVLREYEANEFMYHTALDDGKANLVANTLTDIQWATLILAMQTVIKGEDYVAKLLNGDFPKIEEAIRVARKADKGRATQTRIWVALFAGYHFFIKGKDNDSMPQKIRTIYTNEDANSTNRDSKGSFKPLPIVYPIKD